MEDSIDKILSQLGHVIEVQITAANDRANASDARLSRLVGGLSVLLGECSSNDNESVVAEAGRRLRDGESRARAKSAPARRATRSEVSNEIFLASLTSEWITAGKLHKLMLGQGIKIGEGTIYNRMRKLAAGDRNIEMAVRPERWRLRVPHGPAPRPRRAGRKSKAQPSPLSLVPSSSWQTVSNQARTFRPVLHHANCLEAMKLIPGDSVDLILADLPYGMTGLKIDSLLPLDQLWTEYRRILRKPSGNIVLFGSQPFTTALVNAAPDIFRYSMVWAKNSSTGFQHAADKPLKQHEDILLFSYGVNISAKRTKRRATYNPQGVVPVRRKAKGVTRLSYLSKAVRGYAEGYEFTGLSNCPTDILRFPKESGVKGEKSHPFAKPVELLEHLIRTYSNPGDLVLDNTMGGGSTCLAAMNTERRSIGIERDRKWFELAVARIEAKLATSGSASEAA